MDDLTGLRDGWVQFRLRDAYLPDARDLSLRLHGEDLLQGRVVGVSDSGTTEAAYVVVQVEGIGELIVVPTTGILARTPGSTR
ncbi:MAG: hypothetical protein QM767_29220 [Anaeromyxobacter sp.]